MKSALNRVRGFAWLFVLLGFGLAGVRSSAAPASSRGLEQEKDLGAQLRRFQVQDILIPSTAGASLTIPLSLDGEACELQLEVHSLRADGFRVLVQDDRGDLREEKPPVVQTYRGKAEGMSGARVAASIADGRLSAVILLADGSRWHVEPMAEGPQSQPIAHIVYHSKDVVEQTHECAAGDDADGLHVPRLSDDVVAGLGGTTRICDVAFDADYEFFLANDNSVSQTVNDIENVLNGVSLLYETELNITYELTTVVIRTGIADPYSSTDPSVLLNQFRSEWNAQMLDVHRDIAHLMTGRTLANSVIGNAFINVMCDSCAGGAGYGLSRSRFNGLMSNRICLTAHEIGHNWGACHCNDPNCTGGGADPDCGVMCSMLGGCAGTCTSFGERSLATINATASSAPCLATLAPPLQFPVCETFESGLSNSTWSYNAASSVTTTASNPPSPPNALRIDNFRTECTSAPDDIRTNFINLAGVSAAMLLYHTQHDGGFSTSGSRLVVEYWSSDHAWIELNRVVSDGLDQIDFEAWSHQLPANALHDEARIRFRLVAVSDADVWYLDNFAVLLALPESPVLYVRRDADPGGAGMSWNEAFDDLQDALIVAACAGGTAGEIWVGQGTYQPDRGSADRSSTFQLRKGVALLGGFSGTELEAVERNPELNPTVLSGDIGLAGIVSDDAYHVVTGNGTNATAVLDGFTISNGRAVAASNDGGGGLRIVGGSPTITNCVFSNNTGNNGGGLYIGTNSIPRLNECTLFGNTAFLAGGGLYVAAGGRPYFDRCRILSNSSVNFGGGILNAFTGRVDLINTILSGNSSSSGGGIYNQQTGTVTLQNCTLSSNVATIAVGGLLNSTNGIAIVNSSVLWGNRDSSGMFQSSQIAGALPVINYTCIQGHTGSLGGTGNMGADPLFVDADGADDVPGTLDDQLQLAPASTAVDSGDPDADPALLGPVDLLGDPRILCGRVDRGAYEFGVGDYNCDGTVDLADFADWPTCVTGPQGTSMPACADFDFNVDTHVDLRDFARFQRVFSGP